MKLDDDTIHQIRMLVWKGSARHHDARGMLAEDDLLEGDPALLATAFDPEWASKAKAEDGWPALTDCDRLDRATLAFGAFAETPGAKRAIGDALVVALTGSSLQCHWDGDPERRIEAWPFAWQRRAPK